MLCRGMSAVAVLVVVAGCHSGPEVEVGEKHRLPNEPHVYQPFVTKSGDGLLEPRSIRTDVAVTDGSGTPRMLSSTHASEASLKAQLMHGGFFVGGMAAGKTEFESGNQTNVSAKGSGIATSN